ncbi:hypothetical protein GCM10022224_004980 [Nonomuraea antimicrobica]|uniref:Uncharacterized protein n=1 Tax=Nonomuraea antimicrobica TaxID=561173 RepID=A0ABP7B0N4_9ACTN
MGSELHSGTAVGSAVDAAEFIVSSARLTELYECAVLLRRTRIRAEEIVNDARALVAEVELQGDAERAFALRGQLDQADEKYRQVLNAYLLISRKIEEERQDILRAHMEPGRSRGLSGVA